MARAKSAAGRKPARAAKPKSRRATGRAAAARTGAAARKRPGLLERLAEGPVICAEGYLFELERRGYLQAGAFVPEVVLDHPEKVEELHREFVHAGSDVVEAFTYYAHREKLRMIGRGRDLESMNRQALKIAKSVARETGTLVAGNISNSTIYDPSDSAALKAIRRMFEEQIGWAVDAGVDFIIGETYAYGGEAVMAAEAIKRTGLPAVVTMARHREALTREGWTLTDAVKRIEAAGAEVVGLNCARGPSSMLPLLREVRAAVRCHVAALPVPYRTTADQTSFQSLTDANWTGHPGARAFPTALDPFTCNRYEIADFARQAHEMRVRYLGVCCGAGPHHIRAMAEAIGRKPPASRYSPDMSKHYAFGSDPSLKKHNVEYKTRI